MYWDSLPPETLASVHADETHLHVHTGAGVLAHAHAEAATDAFCTGS